MYLLQWTREKKSAKIYGNQKIKKIASSIRKLNCKNVIVKIPDIEIKAEYFFRCLNILMEYSFDNITVILENECLSKSTINKLMQYNISLIIQKEVKGKDIEQAIELYKMISNLKGTKINSLLLIVYDDEVKDKLIKQISFLLKEKGINCIISRYIRKEEAVNYYSSQQQFTNRTSIETYSYNQYFHPCLGGLIYFDQSGDVYPCPNLLDFKMGSIDKFEEVWNKERLHKFWNLTSVVT